MLRIFPAALALAGAFLLSCPSMARDLGQWGNSPKQIQEWYAGLMQPDDPTLSCCGRADAYWSDMFEAEGDHYVAIITDERDDAPLGRKHRDAGTRVAVPNQKLKYDAGNPTGHGVIFILYDGVVLCYVTPSLM